jgi:hypothetical protein
MTTTTRPAIQASILNAINDASRDAFNAAKRLERLSADIAQSIESGEYTDDGGLMDTALKLVQATKVRHLLIRELAKPAGCTDGEVILAATNADEYWISEV